MSKLILFQGDPITDARRIVKVSLLCDGVHPTAAGHMLIMQEWMKTFEKIK